MIELRFSEHVSFRRTLLSPFSCDVTYGHKAGAKPASANASCGAWNWAPECGRLHERYFHTVLVECNANFLADQQKTATVQRLGSLHQREPQEEPRHRMLSHNLWGTITRTLLSTSDHMCLYALCITPSLLHYHSSFPVVIIMERAWEVCLATFHNHPS
jgi:hypothetical protein